MRKTKSASTAFAWKLSVSDEKKTVVMQTLMDLIASLEQRGGITIARMCRTCRFFGEDEHEDSAAPHHCNLLDMPLAPEYLRVDCPEHELA